MSEYGVPQKGGGAYFLRQDVVGQHFRLAKKSIFQLGKLFLICLLWNKARVTTECHILKHQQMPSKNI